MFVVYEMMKQRRRMRSRRRSRRWRSEGDGVGSSTQFNVIPAKKKQRSEMEKQEDEVLSAVGTKTTRSDYSVKSLSRR